MNCNEGDATNLISNSITRYRWGLSPSQFALNLMHMGKQTVIGPWKQTLTNRSQLPCHSPKDQINNPELQLAGRKVKEKGKKKKIKDERFVKNKSCFTQPQQIKIDKKAQQKGSRRRAITRLDQCNLPVIVNNRRYHTQGGTNKAEKLAKSNRQECKRIPIFGELNFIKPSLERKKKSVFGRVQDLMDRSAIKLSPINLFKMSVEQSPPAKKINKNMN